MNKSTFRFVFGVVGILLQSYKKSSAEQKKLVSFFLPRCSNFTTLSQSYKFSMPIPNFAEVIYKVLIPTLLIVVFHVAAHAVIVHVVFGGGVEAAHVVGFGGGLLLRTDRST